MTANINEEYFDVVDVNDNVVEQLTRFEVHRRKLLHRAVHVFMFRSDGTLLIHRRSATKEEFPSVWTSSCSGHVSAGEDYDTTAVRELEEELGVKSAVERLQKFSACPDTSHEFTVLYQCTSDAVVTPDSGEISAIKWMTMDDIQRWMEQSPDDFSPAFCLLFRWYVRNTRIPETR